ncbi:MAG: DUF4340 domain-containing protein, partial [Halobacteriovoraceae bacterium]|nr:DUF4340 domain-containing protein [Halobacteriovoraceae bacterium]
MEIDLTTKLDEKKQIKVGLINPINNTSYLTVSGHKYIFQTNLFEESLERLELSDFIDSQIFSMPSHAITSFKLYQGKNKQPFIELKYLADNWTTQKYKVISNINTDKKINSILNVKPHMILDRQDEKLKNFIDNYLKNPRYKIVIKLKNNQIKTYEISYITRAIKDLKIEKKQYFIMRASDRTYPYIVHKSHLSKFTIRYSDLKN